jgi:hypothetical protein
LNKKELSEIRNKFMKDAGTVTIHKITSAYINPADEDEPIIYVNSEIPGTIAEDRYSFLKFIFGSVLKGRIGKGNKEYKIVDESTKALFESTVYNNMNSSEDINIFINTIVNNYNLVSPYAVFVANVTYSYIKKNDDVLEDTDDTCMDTEDYDFMITAICPVENVTDGLIYHDEFIYDTVNKNAVEMPINGFIYPTFSDRTPDFDSILVYDKNCKKPNKDMAMLCGADFTYTIPQQKEMFDTMLSNVMGKELNYELLTDINTAFEEKLVEQSVNTEPATITKQECIQTLIEAGVDPKYKEHFSKNYDTVFGDVAIDTPAIVNDKTTIKMNSFKITFSNSESNMLSTKEINGKRCIVITIDGNIDVNDVTVTN